MKQIRRSAVVFASLLAPVAFAGEVAVPAGHGAALVRLSCSAGAKQTFDGEGVFCARTNAPGAERLTGPYVGFHTNGVKEAEGQYLDGNRVGLWTFFDDAGNKIGETEFRSDQFHGRRVVYFANGRKKVEETWVKGLRQGQAREWSETGAVVVKQYRDDRLVTVQN